MKKLIMFILSLVLLTSCGNNNNYKQYVIEETSLVEETPIVEETNASDASNIENNESNSSKTEDK